MVLYTALYPFASTFAADASRVKELIDHLQRKGHYEHYNFFGGSVEARSLPINSPQTRKSYSGELEVLISVQTMRGVKVFLILEKIVAEDGSEDFVMYIDQPDEDMRYGQINDAIQGRLNANGMFSSAVPLNLKDPATREFTQSEFDRYFLLAYSQNLGKSP